jgi:hypothetical protein
MVGLKARRRTTAGGFRQASWSGGEKRHVSEEIQAEQKKRPWGRPFQKGVSGNPGGRPKKIAEAPLDVPEMPEDISPGERQVLIELWKWGKSGRQGAASALRNFYEFLYGKAGSKQPTRSVVDDVRPETWTKICSLADLFGMPYNPCPACGHIEYGMPRTSVTTQVSKTDSGFVPPSLEDKREIVPAPSPDYGKAQGAEEAALVVLRQQTTSAKEAEENRREHEAGPLPKL